MSKKEENQERLAQTGQVAKITDEILDHMLNPKNYGVMKASDGIGMGADKKTGEMAMVYIKVEDDILTNITFGCNACQDTVVAGSLFTEMVKGDTLENSIKAMILMEEKLDMAPKKQQACSKMVLEAFRGALRNRESHLRGIDEEMCVIDLKDSCEGVNNGI